MATQPRLAFPLHIVLISTICLSGCVGGPVARQIASSIATQAADKITANIMENHFRQDDGPSNPLLRPTRLDPEVMAAMMGKLQTVPVTVQAAPPPEQQSKDEPSIKVSKLVPVKVNSFILGDEKEAILSHHDANRLASPNANWESWRLAEGSAQNASGSPMLFLIPPEFGKMTSGDTAVIELDGGGGLAIARYKL